MYCHLFLWFTVYKYRITRNTPCLSKSCATIHSFISLTNVDRFPKISHCRILHDIFNKIRVMSILFSLSYLLILWTLKTSYCVPCSRILQVSVSCVLQGSGVTSLKYFEIYDMDFVANFTENTTVKNWKSVNICQTYERMYSGTVFIETDVNVRTYLINTDGRRMDGAVAPLGLVLPGAATDGCHPLFPKKLTTSF